MFAAVSTGDTHGIRRTARQKFLRGKFAWKNSARRNPMLNWNRMLKNANRTVLTTALQNTGSATAAWYWVSPLNGMSPLTKVSTVACRKLRVKLYTTGYNSSARQKRTKGRMNK